jgi:hypothetical protein
LVFFALSALLPAAIVSTTGAAIQIAPAAGNSNANAYDDQNCSESGTATDCPIRGWDELQNHVLAASLTTDAYSAVPSVVLAAGTVINSHMLFFDPKYSTSRTGTFTFDGDILGIIEGDQTLFDTDFLGSPSATYPAAVFNLRGLETNTDSILVSGNTITLRYTASNPGDQLRVLTRADGGTGNEVPEPGTYALIGAGLIGLGLLRRKRKI